MTYAIGLHLLLAIVLLKSNFIQKVEHKLGITSYQDEITDDFRRMLKYHMRMDGNVPNNSVVFIGDSITQGLAVTAVASPSINCGISCDTSYGVLKRIRRYKSIENASAVVIAIGVNDMKYRSNKKILWNLADEFHEGDGIHLNSRGNAIWIDSLKVALKNVRHLYPHSGPTVSVQDKKMIN